MFWKPADFAPLARRKRGKMRLPALTGGEKGAPAPPKRRIGRRVRWRGEPIKPARTARSTAAKAAGAQARTGNDGASGTPETGEEAHNRRREKAHNAADAAAGKKRKQRTGNTHPPAKGVPEATATTSDKGRTSGAAPSDISDFCRANDLRYYLIIGTIFRQRLCIWTVYPCSCQMMFRIIPV